MLTNTTNAATLPELFDSLFASIERENISIAERLHIIEMAAVLADLYATQITIMLSELTRISPIPSERPAYTHFAAPVIAALQAQSEFATQRSGEYRKLHERLRTTHPQIAGPWNAPKTILHAYHDIFTYPLGRLLQALPDEITNQRSFTSEQVQACRTVAMLADLANRTAIDGIQAIGESPQEYFSSYLITIFSFNLKFNGILPIFIIDDLDELKEGILTALACRNFGSLSPEQAKLLSSAGGLFFYHGN